MAFGGAWSANLADVENENDVMLVSGELKRVSLADKGNGCGDCRLGVSD